MSAWRRLNGYVYHFFFPFTWHHSYISSGGKQASSEEAYIGEVIGPEIKKQPGSHGFMIPGFGARSRILIDVRS